MTKEDRFLMITVCLFLALVSAACGGSDQTINQTIQQPIIPGDTQSIATVTGENWSRYSSKNDLSSMFGWPDPLNVMNYVDLVSDPLFGKVVRITFPQNSGSPGPAPRLQRSFAPLDDMWYRWRMKFGPGWTTVGPDPAGHANSYKVAFFGWPTSDGRGQVEITNSTQYMTGFGVVIPQGTSLSYTFTPLPNSAPDFGRITTEWSDGEWWEYVIHYKKTGPTSAVNAYWRRRLTTNGAIAPGAWVFHGGTPTGSPTPQVSSIHLGANKNKNNPTNMHIFWGPWEVVDGSKQSNPFGVPNGA